MPSLPINIDDINAEVLADLIEDDARQRGSGGFRQDTNEPEDDDDDEDSGGK